MKKAMLVSALTALVFMPATARAHDPISVRICADDVVKDAATDCAQVDTDTEFEDGVYLTADGDDTDPRGDGTTDGYITVHVSRTGSVTVYCEDEGGFNHPGTDEDDANGDNEPCSP